MPPVETPAELILEAGRESRHYWRDLWRYRELLGFLAWRDIKVRYKQTTLGVAWALLQPLVTMGIFSFVFGVLAGMGRNDPTYPLVVMAGVLPWQLFAATLNGASGSLVANSHLVSKVYFPRLIVPLSAFGVALVDFSVVLALYAAMAAWFGAWPGIRILLLPGFVACALLIALGAGLWLTALTVKYRDFRYIVPFMLQVGLFLSPIGFRTDVLPNWRDLLALNPMTGVIDAFRWCLLGAPEEFYWRGFATSMGVGLTLFVTGLWYFRRTERSFADVI
ncbi:MAG TPA: ABC transporter permease [Opitutaceae bacterium]|nr:ABC transporter permease [Opitutaceae bacterium]